MQYNGIAIRWKTHAFFLWIWVCSTGGISAYLPCQQTTNRTTLPRKFKNCNLSFDENGHLHALCHIHVKPPIRNGSDPANTDIMTMEQLLVSEDAVRPVSQGCAPVSLSLRRVRLKKWDDFHDHLDSSYDHIEMEKCSNQGLRLWYSMQIYMQQMTFDVTFGKPPPVAVAMCDSKQANRSGIFSVYSFADPLLYAFPGPEYFRAPANTTMPWNISFFSTDAVITLDETWEEIPTAILEFVAVTPIRHFAFYRCNFHNISFNDIPPMKSIQNLEFLQSPIENVHPEAFDHIPSVTKISLTGTKLPGIPEAIFSLKTLACVNMSDTNVPPEVEFSFWPGSRNRKSSAEQLITSGSKVTVLRDRDLCGFPNVHELHMDGCDLKILQGSPFICLKKLQVLFLQANKIPELNEATLAGLTSLLVLNLNRNRLTVFHGTNILFQLVSLRVLDISFNSIQQLRVDKPLNSSLDVLFAEHNAIKKWTPPTFSGMTKLKMLDLSYNEFAWLDNEMFLDLNGTKNVSLSYNPWDCYSCYLNNLHNFLDKHQVQCAECMTCKVPEEQHGYPVRSVAWREEQCVGVDYYRVYVVPGILCIIVSATLVYGAYKSRWYFIYISLYLKVGIKGYRRKVNVGNYVWDAFASYHVSDSDWVHDVLLPKLESPLLNFRVCVAERDFIPGTPITENICRAISQSRVSLFVLSPEFCRSRWCMFELSLAQHRLSDSERHDGLIFIKKEHIPECEMSDMLLFLTESRTYIEVPPSNATERRNNLFWLQLQAALQR
ncbi:toll-like receptor 2 [Haemaphysalis longicornis]